MTSNTEKTKTERWEERWATGMTGWDLGKSHPALTRFLASEKAAELDIPTKGKALVPGCGLGYDLLTFAKRGMDATGLDISRTGAEAARNWLKEHTTEDSALGDRVKVTRVDFFEYSGEEYDLIYDHTFLCALEPHLRQQWSRQITSMSRNSPSTRLITLMFPLDGQPGGPPFSLTVETYHELLDGDWEMVWSEDVLGDERRRGGSMGGEKLAVWKRRA